MWWWWWIWHQEWGCPSTSPSPGQLLSTPVLRGQLSQRDTSGNTWFWREDTGAEPSTYHKDFHSLCSFAGTQTVFSSWSRRLTSLKIWITSPALNGNVELQLQVSHYLHLSFPYQLFNYFYIPYSLIYTQIIRAFCNKIMFWIGSQSLDLTIHSSTQANQYHVFDQQVLGMFDTFRKDAISKVMINKNSQEVRFVNRIYFMEICFPVYIVVF